MDAVEARLFADIEASTQTGGYDVDMFVDPPDYDLICIICQGVFRCPVRAACHHIFCKKCISQWLKRQETCPCCRTPINPKVILLMFKLSKSIGRMKIKCKNEIRGCAEIFPLSQQYSHSMRCLYELIQCPHQGCRAQLLRRNLDTHSRHCEHWRQPCHMGCGTILSRSTEAQHNCYKQLRQKYEARQRKYKVIATALQRKMKRMQSNMAHVKRQISLICEGLEVIDHQPEVEEDHPGENSNSETRNC
ncbi:RING finger protein 151 [Eucyclogobius newberryi]|uniref:RING finger protein 151 n=1 Tax=Eucyclogobius newberryi TaxID=166745 RepID=UPI003B5AE006